MFKTFEEIDAWQEARFLAKTVRDFRTRAILHKDFGWENQIARSVLSITANIAEGNDATTNAEFLNFLGYAKRSCAETASHLYYGLDHGYIRPEELTSAIAQARKIGAMLARLMMYLRSVDNTVRLGSFTRKN
jgi:four helix bundle protein